MYKQMMRYGRALCFAGVLAMAGCSGEDGATGPAGPAGPEGPEGQAGTPGTNGTNGSNGSNGSNGTNGADLVATAKPESCGVCHADAGVEHQSLYNKYTDASTLVATIDSVASVAKGTTPETYDVTVTFSLKKNGVAYDLTTTQVRALAQKTVYVTKYDPATRQFTPSTSLSVLDRVAAGQYTAKNNAAAATPVVAAFAPETSNAMVYAYFAENPTLVPNRGSYRLYDNVASVAQAFGTLDFVSAANVAACEKCHGAPYMKHGYRAGAVAGIPDMAACKACHYDTRNGGHQDWQLLVDDALSYALVNDGDPATNPANAPDMAKYAYKATTMNDTHMSHAMEFAYPQSMANCATCHEGKLAQILNEDFFNLTTCKSCHPVTGTGGTDAKRAPALLDLFAAVDHMALGDLYNYTGMACNTCHADSNANLKFSAIHTGYNSKIYKADGTKYSSSITTAVGAVAFDSATNILTIPFSVAGVDANAIIKPTVVISLYGYDTKDFVVGGHASQPAPDSKRNLEWAEGASQNSPRLTVAPATAAAGNTNWVATANLSLWAAKLADGSIKKAEIGILPAIGIDQLVAPNNSATTGTPPAPNPAYNPYIAVAGASKTFDLVGNALVADADVYGKAIVSPAKCNACHDALGTTFHSPAYGAAGVVGCRLCHVVGSGGSHLEMQSRSIDSYVHAIHSMQPFDIGDTNFDKTSPTYDPVAVMKFNHHVESTYPNFTLLNCESCHNPGMYGVPDQFRSMPGLHSKSDVVAGGRNIGDVPSYVTGPGSRACGGCHRAKMVNEDLPGELAAFNEHTSTFGYLLNAATNASAVLDAAIAKVMSWF